MSTVPTPAPGATPASAQTPAFSPVKTTFSARYQFLLVWLAVASVCVVAHFAFSRHIGLYEDDHWIIGTPMCEWNSIDQLLATEKSVLTTFLQGRPLQCAIGFLLAYASTHLGCLPTAFATAGAIWALNIALCLALLWRRYGPLAATTATLVFALLPADTTQPMLHTAFCVHPSVTFLLLSGLAYSRGWRLFSVLLAALSLMTYETCFLPALVWPVLFPDAVRPLWRRCLTHGLALGIVLVAIFFVRVHLGESRAAGAVGDKQAMMKKVRELAITGPKSSGKSFIARPKWVITELKSANGFDRPGPGRWTVLSVMLGCAGATMFALVIARRFGCPSEPIASTPNSSPAEEEPTPNTVASETPAFALARLLVCGAAMVILGYVVALNREPQIVEGRMSSVHIASALGWGVFAAGAFGTLGSILTRLRVGWTLFPLLAAYLCLLVGFHVLVQREYIRGWAAQREFWQEVAVDRDRYPLQLDAVANRDGAAPGMGRSYRLHAPICRPCRLVKSAAGTRCWSPGTGVSELCGVRLE
jgi:hypothetical protein